MSEALVISLTVVVDEDFPEKDVAVKVLTATAGELVKHGIGVSLSLNPTSDDDEDTKV